MDLLKSLAQADIGTAISDVDLKMAQARNADQQTEMTAEQMRALRFKQAEAEKEQLRMETVHPAKNIIDTVEQAMPGATPILVQHAQSRGYIDENGGISTKNLYRLEEEMQKNPALAQGVLNGRLGFISQKVNALENELSDPKLKPEDRQVKWTELKDARAQALALSRNKSEIDKAIAGMTGRTGAQFATGEIPASGIEDRTSEATQARLDAAQMAADAKRETGAIREKKNATDQLIKQDATLAADERNALDALTKIKAGKQPMVINFGNGSSLPPPATPARNTEYVQQLQDEIASIKMKRTDIQKRLHSGVAESEASAAPATSAQPKTAPRDIQIVGKFKDEAEVSAAYSSGRVKKGDAVEVAGKKMYVR